jgi:hypothetical protein
MVYICGSSHLQVIPHIVQIYNVFSVICCTIDVTFWFVGVGFEGSNCEVNIDDCVQASCPDNRVCVDGVNGYDCRCRQGFTGDNCTTSIDFCEENPCQNNATCSNTYGNYTCICPIGITGESFICIIYIRSVMSSLL